MGMLERFFHVAAILSLIIFVINMSLMTFTEPLLGASVDELSVTGMGDYNAAVSRISQSSYTPSTASVDSSGLGGIFDFVVGMLTKYDQAIKLIFSNVDTTQHCEYTLGVFPLNCNDTPELFGAMLISIIRFFQVVGLIYLGIAVIAVFFGGEKP